MGLERRHNTRYSVFAALPRKVGNGPDPVGAHANRDVTTAPVWQASGRILAIETNIFRQFLPRARPLD